MPKTKSKPDKKSAPKGSTTTKPKKKPERDTPLSKDQGKAFEQGLATAPLSPKPAKKGTKKRAATDVLAPVASAPAEPKPMELSSAPPDGPAALGPEALPTITEAPAASAVESPPASPAEAAPTTTTTAPEAKVEADEPRMPPVGTVISKLDRQGAMRCECTVVEGGVLYAGKVYKSLSGAAIAAAKDLGLAAKAMNGWTFWGLSKPARARSHADPTAGLQRTFDRYVAHLDALLEKTKAGENREPVLARLQRHARVLQNLHDEEVA